VQDPGLKVWYYLQKNLKLGKLSKQSVKVKSIKEKIKTFQSKQGTTFSEKNNLKPNWESMYSNYICRTNWYLNI
jgi:hypothetical protein